MEHNKTIKRSLIVIAIGIWFLVFQNAGLLPQFRSWKVSGDGPLPVTGTVKIDDFVVIKGKVDANIESINGYGKFYKDPRTGQYYVLPVTDPYE